MSDPTSQSGSQPAAAPAGPVREARRTRWWPAAAVMVLAAVAYVTLWFIPHLSEQHFTMHVGRIIIISSALLLVWLMLFSRLRWRVRFAWLAGVLGAVGLMAALFRIHGVTGNLVPIVEFRWTRHAFVSGTGSNAAPSSAPMNVPGIAGMPGSADFPQFLGPDRNAVLAGPRLGTNWNSQPPELLWRIPVGAAWSGFIVSGGIAVTQEQRGEEECVVAYGLGTGKVLWTHADPVRYFNTLAGEGPRATPAVSGTRLFTQGATGLLNCLDLATGRVLWTVNILTNNGAGVPAWGQASSPLILEDRVIVAPGGRRDRTLVAYGAGDGSFLWGGGTEGDTYSSPMSVTLGGVSQILLFADSISGYDPADGKPLWKHRWPGGHPHVAMPVVVGESDVVVSSGYGTGSGRYRAERDKEGKWKAVQIWRSNRMKAKFTNLVAYGGYLYGLDDGTMACVDIESGELKWKDGKYGHGQVLKVGGVLLVMAEDGNVVLVDPNPAGLSELTRFKALNEKTWNPPALAGRYLLVRNDKEAACFRLPVADAMQ